MDVSNLPVPLGATGILAIVFLMVMRGKLVPRSVHEDRMKDKDTQIKYLETALQRTEQRNGELMSQVGLLMEVATTAEHVFESLPMAATGRDDGSKHELASS